uniref:Uncharacterized protein n=1 Tax=Romanomermis culicivorax TaxID=13658 RepID=A0A915L424_ROMCU
MAHRRVRNE